MFGRVHCPVVLIDGQFRVMGANRLGAELLNVSDFVQRRGEVLICADDASDARLRTAIRSARLASDDVHQVIDTPEAVNGRRVYPQRQLSVSITVLASAARDPASALTLLMFQHVPQASLDLAGNAMQLFGLTSAQARVASELASGKTIKQIAFYSGVSVNTVRHHVKAIFAKTGTNRQVELVQMLARLAQVNSAGQAASMLTH